MPLNWLTLIITFIIIFFIFNTLIYFNFTPNLTKKTKLSYKKLYNWKW